MLLLHDWNAINLIRCTINSLVATTIVVGRFCDSASIKISTVISGLRYFTGISQCTHSIIGHRHLEHRTGNMMGILYTWTSYLSVPLGGY